MAADVRDSSTRAALLTAAAQAFADVGFRAARVRDIAARAGANLAAINYHFGSKQGLYLAVLQAEAQRTIERHPIAQRAPAQGAQGALRDAVAGLLGRFLADDARSYAPRLLIRELISPTDALGHVIEQVIRPQFQQVFAVVTQMLGPAVPAEQARLCVFSIVGQCMFYLVARPVVERLAADALEAERLDVLIDSITALTAAGLEARRHHYEETQRA